MNKKFLIKTVFFGCLLLLFLRGNPDISSAADFLDLQVKDDFRKNIDKKLKFVRTDIIRRSIGDTYCLICLPDNYNPEKRYPVFLGFHGYGSLPEEIILWWADKAAENGFILVSAKSRGKGWDKKDKHNIFKLLAKLKKNYSVDDKNIFLFGHSSGANFSLYLGLNYPYEFKGIAAVAGSLYKTRKYIGKAELSDQDFNKIPIFLIVGKTEHYKNLEYARSTKKSLKKYGYDFNYDEIPKMGHTYKSVCTDIISEWMKNLAFPRDVKNP